jgi:putative nucleotidyltransferase with HDIG domain/PAS domain S-box-containing protein
MTGDAPPSARPRVLIVEDEAVVALDVRHRLSRLGYGTAGLAVTGEQAVTMAASLAPDVILMDIMLEGSLDGVEAARRIRESPGSPPIVFLTAHSDPATLRRAGDTGPHGYVIKPFDERDLYAALEIALCKSRMERRLAENDRWMAITVRSMGEGLLAADASGRVRVANPMAEALLGRPAAALVGCALDAVYRSAPEASPPSSADGRPGWERAFLRSADGRDIPVEQNRTPILDDRGGMFGTVVVFRDVSHRHQAERALRESVDNLRRTLAETVNALTVTSEKRDPFTAGHQERVSRLACALAGALGLSEEEQEGVRVAGLVHDIGKIHVPSEILAKPEVLSDLEMGIVRDHCAVGHEILKDIPFPWPVARMVLEHHERLDGSGYPGGLNGADTLLASRILVVADVVEAMNSHRPYRVAPGLDEALAEIRSGRGVRYDQDVVDACLELFAAGAFCF